MTDPAEYFMALPTDDKVRFLAQLAHNLTVRMRGALLDKPNDRSPSSPTYALNELLHTVTAHLARIIRRDDMTFPDEVFIRILGEIASQGKCERDLNAALEWLRPQFIKPDTEKLPE